MVGATFHITKAVVPHMKAAGGGRIINFAATLLKREKGKYALATQCIGGGQGIATILERI